MNIMKMEFLEEPNRTSRSENILSKIKITLDGLNRAGIMDKKIRGPKSSKLKHGEKKDGKNI